MKLSRLLLYAAVGLCVSCQKNGKEVDTPALSISTRVSGQQGANNFSAWLEGDKMAIDFITGEQVSRFYFTQLAGGRWLSDRTVTSADGLNESTQVKAYFPWGDAASVSQFTLPANNGVVNQSDYSGLHGCDWMISDPSLSQFHNKTKSADIVFNHQLSCLRVFYVYSEAMAEQPVPSDVRILHQPLTYDVSGTVPQSSGEGTVIPTVIEGQMEAILIPHSLVKGAQLMSFNVGDKSYQVVLPDDFTFLPGKAHTLYLAVGQYEVGIIPAGLVDWDEDDLGSADFFEYLQNLLVQLQWDETEMGNGFISSYVDAVSIEISDWTDACIGEGSIVNSSGEEQI